MWIFFSYLQEPVKKVNDILTAFARVVSKCKSGVLNSYQLIADIFEDSQRGNLKGG